MKLSSYFKAALPLLAGAFALLSSPLEAAVNSYHISVNTSSLASNPGAPFSLDFQFNGGGPFSNSVTITNFDFGGGSAQPAKSTFGLASGDIASTVFLTATPSSAFNELFQAFIPGSLLQFDVSLTDNVNTPTPDLFSFAILDSAFQNIPTAGLGNSLLLVELASPAPIAQPFSSGSVAAAVPEPAAVLIGMALVGACATARRRRSA